MKNYAHKTNKQMTRYRTPSTFRGNVKFGQNPVKIRNPKSEILNKYKIQN